MYHRSMTVKYCCIQAFYWMSCAVIMGFVNLYLLDAGYTSTSIGTIIAGGSSEMGTSMALAAIIEIPTMVFFSQLLKIAKCHTWFRICGIFFMLKSLFTLLVPSIPGFYAVQLFQMGGWGIISVSAVYYASSIMAPRDTVKGQAYYTVSFTLGNVLGAILGGWLIDLAGVTTMLIFGTACAFVGAVILLAFTQNPDAK